MTRQECHTDDSAMLPLFIYVKEIHDAATSGKCLASQVRKRRRQPREALMQKAMLHALGAFSTYAHE